MTLSLSGASWEPKKGKINPNSKTCDYIFNLHLLFKLINFTIKYSIKKYWTTLLKIFSLDLLPSQTSGVQLAQLHHFNQRCLVELYRLGVNFLFDFFPIIFEKGINLSNLVNVSSKSRQINLLDFWNRCFLFFVLFSDDILGTNNTWSFNNNTRMFMWN